MSAIIKVFQVGQKRFTHFMNTRNDTIELRNEEGEILLRYDDSAKVSNHDGYMGCLYFEHCNGRMRWIYNEISQQSTIVPGPDLQSAEVEVSRRYIDRCELFS